MKTLILLTTLALTACSTSPTGRKQLKLVGSSQMSQMGSQSFSEIQKKKPLSYDNKKNQQVRCVTDAILTAMGESPSAWTIKVFNDAEPNAFALPGNNMGVHTGLLQLVQNQDQLAAVIGHEIGHVKASHGNERVSQSMVVQLGMTATQIALGNDSKTDQMILGALGVGAQFGVLLPFSRKHETEADYLGVQYMAKAGFDPREAAQFWHIMKKAAGGRSQPEILSTHPSPDSRIRALSGQAQGLMGVYESVQNKPYCF